jgi:hypothetical protein
MVLDATMETVWEMVLGSGMGQLSARAWDTEKARLLVQGWDLVAEV